MSNCPARAGVCVLRGSYKTHASHDIEKRKRLKHDNGHARSVLRKQDEWPLSNVVQKHSSEYPKQRTPPSFQKTIRPRGLARQKGIFKLMHALATRKHAAEHKLSLATWLLSERDRCCSPQSFVAPHRGHRFLATDREKIGGESITARIRPLAKMHKISRILADESVLSSGRGSSLEHCMPLFKKNRCKSVFGQKD